MNFRERLIEKIRQKRSAVCVGLDPDTAVDQFPPRNLFGFYPKLEFAKAIIDEVADLVPVIKPNTRFYLVEEYRQLEGIVKYAHKKDLEVIADVKANDIGNTMARAYEKEFGYFDFDAITVNGYLGTDGITGNEKNPIFKKWFERGKGLFVLVKTSNPSSSQLQDVDLQETRPVPQKRRIDLHNKVFVHKKVWMKKAELVESCGNDYDHVIGGVVGATHPGDIPIARRLLSGVILLPGYGAQGGTGKDVKAAVRDGRWAIVNSSRGVMYAYARRFKGEFDVADFAKASRREVEFMNADINKHIRGQYDAKR